MTEAISRLRERYKPECIELLFVAESPPAPRHGELRFFYNAEQERWDHLYRSLMTAVFPDYEYEAGEKARWLTRFKERGYYLIDATDRPINRLARSARLRELEAAIPHKLAEISGLISPTTPIVLIKKNIFDVFSVPLRRAGYDVIHETFLPFPSHGHQKRFIEACRSALRGHRER